MEVNLMRKKFILVALLVLITVGLFAAAPLAGTKIKNQAAATFVDNLGVDRTILSNQVVTNVLPAYSVNVIPDSITYPGAAGGEMQFQFEIQNLGNDADTFIASLTIQGGSDFTPINPEIFYDENGNGKVDPGEVQWADANVTIDPGDFAYVIVRYQVPQLVNAGDEATVILDVASESDPTKVDLGNEANTTIYNDAVVTMFKHAIPEQVAAGDTIQYVISGSNVGNKPASNIEITDTLNSNLTFVSLDAWSPNDATITHSGGVVTYTLNSLDVGESYSFTFTVQVGATTPNGFINNVAEMVYNPQTGDPITRTSNISTVEIGGPGYETALVWVGPDGEPEAVDPDDIQYATGTVGALVSFTNTIKNSGNSTDSINIMIDSVEPVSLTGAFAVSFYADDLTPLPDSDDDGMQDTGPLAPGEEHDIVIKVFLPFDTPVTTVAATAVIKVISSLDPSASDTTTDVIEPISFPAVVIGNASGTATDTNVDKTATTVNVDPGDFYDFPIDIVNNGGAPDSYSLSSPVLPDGYTVRYYIDVNGDGILQPDELIPVNNTGPIPANSGRRIIARVFVPADEAYTGTSEEFVIQATSVNNPATSAEQSNRILVNEILSINLAPSRNGSAAPGTVISYDHTLTNNGNSEVNVKLQVNSALGWTYTFEYLGSVIDINTVFTLQPGESITGTLKLTIPSDTPLGVTDVTYMTATVQEDTSITSSVVDVTFVTSANITLEKEVDKTDAKPGEVLTYSITYNNVGTEPVTDFIVYDVIPFFTHLFSGAVFSDLPTGYSNDFGATFTTGWPPADFDAVTNLEWIIGEIYPGDSETITFQVKIDE